MTTREARTKAGSGLIMQDSEEQSETVTVGRFLDPAEAQMAKGALEAEGIDSFLQGENANSMVPMALPTRLLVSKADEAAAREILEAATAEVPEGDEAA
jgi:hypothetical protein